MSRPRIRPERAPELVAASRGRPTRRLGGRVREPAGVALEADGWDVRFLGTDMPHEGILEAVEKHGASVLGISTTVLVDVDQAVGLIEDARARLGDRTPRIVVGGRAFMAAPGLWRELGADGFAPGVREAVELVRGLGG